MSSDLRIRWHLELVDDASSRLLRQDRQIRTSLQQTERARKSLATAAVRAGNTQVAAAVKTAGALRGEGRSAEEARAATAHYNRAQADALGIGDRLVTTSARVAGAYKAQARELRGLRTEQSRLNRVGATVSSGIRSAGSGASSLGAGAAAAGGRLAAGAAGAATGVAVVGAGFALAERQVASFDQTMDAARGKLLITRKAMEPLRDLAIDLGAKTSFSAKQAAGAIDELAAQGYSVNKIIKILPGTLSLAAASGSDLAQAAQVQTETLHAFGLEAGKAGKVADVLAQISNRSAAQIDDLQDSLKFVAPVAKATGQSLEDMGASIGLLANVGIKGTMAGTTLRTALVRLTNPTRQARGALKDFGLSAADLQGPKGLLPLPAIIGKIARGSDGLSKSQRNAGLAAIFGREALSGVVALMDKGEGKIKKESKALEDSAGAAKRAAHIMRNNVAGAWDNFTGSVEASSIKLLSRFQPALKTAINGAAGLVNRATSDVQRIPGAFRAGQRGSGEGYSGLAGRVADVSRALPNLASAPAGFRAGLSGKSGAETAGFGGVGAVAAKLGGVLHNVAKVAIGAGKQLLDAFKPALPFFQNVLLPLLKGVGEGVLISVVGAFKVAVPIIKVVATVLGAIGKAAKPLKPVIEDVGKVIGFLFSGPILKGIGLLGKLGGVFRIVAGAAKLAAAPLRLLDGISGLLIKGFARLPGAVLGAFKTLPARLAVNGVAAAHAIGSGLGKAVGLLTSVGIRAVQALGRALKSGITNLPGELAKAIGGLAGIGRSIVSAIVNAIGNAGGAIGNAIKGLVPGPLKSAVKRVLPGIFGRSGGRLRASGFHRFAAGGLVPAAVSPGELVAYGDAAWTVPGPRTNADSVTTLLPTGAAVYTASGQAMLAAGASPVEALRYQAPHFAAGGIVGGRYDSTSYGPPWGGIQGTGVTATGVNLKGSPRLYGVAVDPRLIKLGSRPYIWPNPFGYNGRFQAFDTGGAIKGRRIDFYDWRGRSSQNRWGHHQVAVADHRLANRGQGNTFTAAGGAGRSPDVRILGRSSRRNGLLGDAFQQGLSAGQAGLTRGDIRKTGNPIIDALREQAAQADRGSSSLSQKFDPTRLDDGKGSPGALRQVAAGTRVPYVWGGGHGGFSKNPRGLDCSGYVSHVLHYGGADPALRSPVTTVGMARYGKSGRGRRVTIHVRNGGPGGGHTMLTIDGRGYSSGNRSTGRLSGRYDVSAAYLSTLPIKRHPVGLRRGGIVGFRTGGTAFNSSGSSSSTGSTLLGSLHKALTFSGGSLQALDDLITAATQARLGALRKMILAKVRAGGPGNVVRRFQSILDLIDFELGRRIGKLEDNVEQSTNRLSRGDSAVDRFLRKRAIDPGSALGLGVASLHGQTVIASMRGNVADLQKALKQAKAHGDKATVRDVTARLHDAQDALDEALTSQAERARQAIVVAAQERADNAGLGLDYANAQISTLTANQRQYGTTDSAGALTQQANAINAQLIPNLQAVHDALTGQLNAAAATGDAAGIRSAQSSLYANAVDLANAFADAADLVRQAAEKAAEKAVDDAAHGTTLANSGLQRLTLEQQLAGTYDAGGQARADYIKANIVPALQAELKALQDKEAVDRQQGLFDDLQKTIEDEAAKSNDLLQASLDAQQAIEENTKPRPVGGTIGFSGFGDLVLTDTLAGSLNGA